VKVEFSESNLFSNIKEKGFDWIIFNPPYLPTEKAERMEGGLNFAFDGGKSGHDTAFRFLEQVGKYLKKDGKVLLVASTAANLAELNDKINGLEYKFEIIAQQSFFFEKIYVYRIYRKKS
jgi:release factor glutamine methyltransferase